MSELYIYIYVAINMHTSVCIYICILYMHIICRTYIYIYIYIYIFTFRLMYFYSLRFPPSTDQHWPHSLKRKKSRIVKLHFLLLGGGKSETVRERGAF